MSEVRVTGVECCRCKKRRGKRAKPWNTYKGKFICRTCTRKILRLGN